ncbi:hypothetical protein I302_108820 [Kwoniella bestiolae CBS 10118]|uniref:Uncharacterized protein n=1 Tax=Kwoniella bestiolae CBS 10118 TaxID=1296100 RepID=A0A1B9FU67_9TREE|nr:hypothetical protein I302_07959 [Kwoniella bestiolae CBS 10118]OCF22312.1 hypothetical protein I302_07959 [Kwoniella bestiolae CBS 10118]
MSPPTTTNTESTSTSLPRLNTQPVPPTPLTADQPTSAPPNTTIFKDLPHVVSPIPTQTYPTSSSTSPLLYDDDPLSGGQQSPSPSPSPRSVLLSPSKTSPTSRPLSPDLPSRDALYLFSNFSSYMRSPNEGSEGLRGDDFRDSIRLLEHARWLSSQPHSNVHILHLKYRFQGQSNTFRSPYSTGDYQLPLNYKDSTGRVGNPVPQPFSVLHDPVVKIDYMENGVFDPLPAQAVFSHIAKMCQPPPRIIVISYVYSKVIENHLSSLSAWALTSSPPSYIFSPLETRLRESQPLHIALGHSIPMSMYAWPNELYTQGNLSPIPTTPTPSTSTTSTRSIGIQGSGFGMSAFSPVAPGKGAFGPPIPGRKKNQRRRKIKLQDTTDTIGTRTNEDCGEGVGGGGEEDVNSPILITRRISGTESPGDIIDRYYARRTSQAVGKENYKNDPIASLTVISSSPPTASTDNEVLGRRRSDESLRLNKSISPTGGSVPPPIDRIPLWHLAPGVGILHGSTSNSIGIKLSDFSAINLLGEDGHIDRHEGDVLKKEVDRKEVEELGIKTEKVSSYHDLLKETNSTNPDANSLRVHPAQLIEMAKAITISRPSSTAPLPQPVGISKPPAPAHAQTEELKLTHLTPPNPNPNHYRSLPKAVNGSSQSWPAPVSRVPGWRKGRKELMEDTLDELGMVEDVEMVRVESVWKDLEGLVVNQNCQNDVDGQEVDAKEDRGGLVENRLIDLLLVPKIRDS